VEQQVRRLSPAIDFVILIRGLYQPLKSPYVAFIDSTVKLNGSSWPPLAHRGGDYAWSVRADTAQLRGAVHVFTAGRHVAEHVVRAYGIPEDHVTAIGGGLNYPLSEVPTRAPSSVPTILFVGHDFQRKGGDVLVDAFTRVRRAIPDARLLLVGRGARLHGRGAGITSLGEVEDRRELSELYRQATVFCLPARFEPVGLVLLEAMAHGVPCVATRVGEIPQILQDGRLGRLVDREDPEALAETLLDLLGDPELQRTLSERARGHVQACRRWDLVADQMVQRLTIERQ
jgi:glycosyltransferase involved in cell wall biosynthesis